MHHNLSPLSQRSARTALHRGAQLVSPLHLLRSSSAVTEGDEELKRALLAFDVDADIAAIIPMPSTIPPVVRAAITQALSERFQEDDDAMEDWLHSSSKALDGATPFERVVAGDGMAVLTALLGSGDHPALSALVAAVHSAPPPLHILR